MKTQNWRLSLSGNPEARFIDITPAMAAEALLANQMNRRVSEPLVRKYAHAMKNGHWHLTHQGVAFFSDGSIADCQHRMKAIQRANVTIKSLVVTGLPKESAIAIDNHRPRSEADRLTIAGFEGEAIKARVAVIRALLQVTESVSASRKFIDTDDMKDILYAVDKELSLVISVTKSTAVRSTHSCVRAALLSAHLHGAIGEQGVTRFAALLESGMDADPEEQGVIRLRDFLLSLKGSGGTALRQEIFLRTQRAIKAFIDRKPINKLYTPENPIWTCSFLFDDQEEKEAA